MDKRGQVTIFVILAIVVVGLSLVYFVFKDTLFPSAISSTFEPVEQTFLDCVESQLDLGIKVLETQGGYLETPEFIDGSSYMPFSSQLNFAGVRIPYWYTVTGNNLVLTQVPIKKEMETQLSDYLEKKIPECGFSSYVESGYTISLGESKVETIIGDKFVRAFVDADLNMKKDNETLVVSQHKVELKTELGSLYDDAVEVYGEENKNLFLEEYAIDFLRNYAPVDGFEISCSPLTWNAEEIFEDVKAAVEVNFRMAKNEGKDDDYFNLDLPIDSDVRILNSVTWPSTYEVAPADSVTLVAEPVGNQQGLGILGFCFVPYHFVYTTKYPVLIQVVRGEEIFQFPMAVIIENNVARNNSRGEYISENNFDICNAVASSKVNVEVRGSDSKLLDAKVSYSCYSEACDVGATGSDGKLEGFFPQCVNGTALIRSENYKDKSVIFSSVKGGSLNVILDKIYEKNVKVDIKNSQNNEKVVLTFTSEDGTSSSLVYPEQDKINLSVGKYNVRVYVYEESNINFEATTTEQCTDVPSGFFGIFGATKKQCTEVEIPAQNITNVLVAGGEGKIEITEENLRNKNLVNVDVERYVTPKTLAELQIIYSLIDAKEVGVYFK